MALKLHQLIDKTVSLDCPPLGLVATALKVGLSNNFQNVEVSVIDCPDLTEKPFNLAGKGFCGSPTIVEVGGVPYLMPLINRTKIYDLKDLHMVSNPAFIVGAGAGPFTYTGVNCELVANLVVNGNREVRNLTQIARLKDESKGNEMVAETLPDTETTFALMGNLFVCEGQPGKVLKVKCSKRIGKSDFITASRESLVSGFPGKFIGVGGAVLITGSKVKQHVMPNFSETPLENEEMINNWLRFYEMNPPLVAVGTFVTTDPGLNLRMMHFHSMSDHNEAGHYHHDVEPDNVEYLAYFNLGEKLIRFDTPDSGSKIGHN